jgi:hypothetical protein
VRNKLIKLLGGRTDEEYDLLEAEYQSQRNLALVLRDQVEHLEKNLTMERDERQRLQEIIFKNYGIVTSDEIPSPAIDKKLNPIRTSPQRWSNLRIRLEEDDRARVMSHVKEFDAEQGAIK